MRKSSKVLAVIMIVAMLFTFTACGSETAHLVFTTGGTTGLYYAIGGEMSSLWAGHVEGVEVTVESSGGSKDNILAMHENNAELAMTQNDVMSYAYEGGDFFEGTVVDNFSAIGCVFPELCHLVVAKDAGIEKFEDLKGHNVSVGPAGSGHFFNATQLLELNGMSLDDIKAQYLDNTEIIEAFQNKQIDAFFITGGFPHASVTDVSLKRDIEIIDYSEEFIEKLHEKYSFFVPATIPGGTYEGVAEDKLVPAINATLVAADSVSEDVIYELTKSLFENVDELTNAKKSYITPEYAIQGVPTKAADLEAGIDYGSFHPGALKYYKEIGLIAD